MCAGRFCVVQSVFPPGTPLGLFFFNDTATTEIYTLSLHDALPISTVTLASRDRRSRIATRVANSGGSIPATRPDSNREMPRTSKFPIPFWGRTHEGDCKPRRTPHLSARIRPRSEEHTAELQSQAKR